MKTSKLSLGLNVTFAAFDGNNYPATVISRPRRGVVRIRYSVRGIGPVEPAVAVNRVIAA